MSQQHVPAGEERGRERGQVIVLLALSLIVMLLFVGLVVDVGNGYAQRRSTQNVADFAALAAARVVMANQGTPGTFTDANVVTAINTTLTDNGIAAGSFTAVYVDASGNPLSANVGSGSIPAAAFGAKVEVTHSFGTYFVGVAGMSTWTATSTATARGGWKLGSQVMEGELLPIAVNFESLTNSCPTGVPTSSCTPVDMTNPGNNLNLTPGQFGWLSWDGDGRTPHLCDMLDGTFSSPAYVVPPNGSIVIPGNTGVSNSSCVNNNMNTIIDSTKTYLVPIVSPGTGNYPGTSIPYPPTCSPCNGSNAKFNIIGFAGFQFTQFDDIRNVSGVVRRWFFLGPPNASVTSSTPGASLAIELVR